MHLILVHKYPFQLQNLRLFNIVLRREIPIKLVPILSPIIPHHGYLMNGSKFGQKKTLNFQCSLCFFTLLKRTLQEFQCSLCFFTLLIMHPAGIEPATTP